MQIINRFIKLLAISAIMLFSVIGISNAYEVGDKITFGRYPFEGDGKKKSIDWIILDIDKNNNALVISDYALDNVKYDEEYDDETWNTSSVRKWLNDEFLNIAFTPEERKKIQISHVENKNNPKHGTKGGKDTDDKLFLLSIEEANKYFNGDQARMAIAYPTPYAAKGKNGCSVSKDRVGACSWWLRSPGYSQNQAARIMSNGTVHYEGRGVLCDYAVRIAFRINLNNKFYKADEEGDSLFEHGLDCYYGRELKQEKDCEKAEWFLLSAAERGHPDAQLALGNMYFDGCDDGKYKYKVKKNYKEAINWYRKAAEQGHFRAQFKLGNIYFHGQGAKQDYGEAIKWYRKAAEQDHPQAQLDLGDMYFLGQGVKQSYGEAIKWYRKASIQGKSRARCRISQMYAKGLGVDRNLKESEKWFEEFRAEAIKNGENFDYISRFDCLPTQSTAIASKPQEVSLEDNNLERSYDRKKNTQKVELLALRKGFHPDRTRLVFDISDACVWDEEDFPDFFNIKIYGATSKITKTGKIGHEVKKFSIFTATEGYTSIRVDKKNVGSYAKVQLLDSPSYKLIIDVFNPKADVSGNSEDLNKYDEILSEEEKQNPEGNITEADRQDAEKAIKALSLQKPPAGKKIIVIDPGHSLGFEGAYFASGAFVRQDEIILHTYETVNGKERLVPLTKKIKKDRELQTVYAKKFVDRYEEMVNEHEITLVQAQTIQSYFKRQKDSPFEVILTRDADAQLRNTPGADLAYRGELAYQSGAAAFISIHTNFVGEDHKKECGASGFEIMYRSTGNGDKGRLDDLKGNTTQEKDKDKERQTNAKEQGKILAGIVSDQLIKNGFKQYKKPYVDVEGGTNKTVAVLRIARYPAILLETGYLCNKEDRERLKDPIANIQIAEALYKGLMEYGKQNGWFK